MIFAACSPPIGSQMGQITGSGFRTFNIVSSQRVLHRHLYSFYKKCESKSAWQFLVRNGPVFIFIATLILFLFIISPNNPLDTLDQDSLYFFSQVILLLLHTSSPCLVVNPGSAPSLIATLPVIPCAIVWIWVVILDFAIPPPSELAC